jgi:hypothetical protein
MRQHQRQQREYFRLVRHQLGQCPAEVDGLRGEVDAATTPAPVKDQVDHGEDARQPVGQLVIGRHGERDARVTDLALGPGQSFAHGLERVELRPGGQLRYIMTATAPEQIAFMRNTGNPLSIEVRKTFTEVARPTRLAYLSLIDFVPDHEP